MKFLIILNNSILYNKPKVRVANMCSGWPSLSPCCVYDFSTYPGRKYHFRSRLWNTNVIYTQHGDKEGHPRAHVCPSCLRLGWPFTSALDWPTLYLPYCVIYYFIIPGPKIPYSRFGAGSESGTFGQGMVKNRILTNRGSK